MAASLNTLDNDLLRWQRHLRGRLIFLRLIQLCWLISLSAISFAQSPTSLFSTGPASILKADRNILFNGWKLTPAGRHVGVAAMPIKIAFSPDGKTLAVVCTARQNGLALIDLQTEQAKQWLPMEQDPCFNGLEFSHDGKQIFVSGGNSDHLYVYDFDSKEATGPKVIHLDKEPKGPNQKNFFAGLIVHPVSGKIYVCNEGTSEIWVINPLSQTIEAKWRTGSHPYTCVLGTGDKDLFVSNWGDRSITALDLETGQEIQRVNVGLRPNEMAVAPDGRLFVCCAGDNTVHVLQTQSPPNTDRGNGTNPKQSPPEFSLEIIATSLYESSPEGSTPNAVAISPDGKSLFVANADNNDVMVADIADPSATRVVGFVPVGWYPCAIATDGKKLFVANGKGLDSLPSFPSSQPPGTNLTPTIVFDPPVHTLRGSVSIIDPPTPTQLVAYTDQVRENSPYTPTNLKVSKQPNESIIPSKVGEACPIKYVLYIIKENRTYDQMYGDIADAKGHHTGNGDPKLCMFGEQITPNHHQLARDYVLLDNLYCNGEVSRDGHAWCDTAIANDFNQRQWIINYTGHGELPGNAELDTALAGNIWDACRRNAVSFRCYGEGSWSVPKENRGTWAGARDPERAQGWIKDLHEAEQNGKLPQFMIMSLGENHTEGTTPGKFTPQACVASNDLAVGEIVEAATHSKFWNKMAIFIIEDDSQNGPDHVDAHRTDGLVISPYCRRGIVDSTHYTQMSMLRTMELILGLPPLTQYDAGATPMFNVFQKKIISTPFQLIAPKIDLATKNTSESPGAQASAKMDFDEYDAAPEDQLNRILWAAVKGPTAPYPTPIHRAIFSPRIIQSQ